MIVKNRNKESQWIKRKLEDIEVKFNKWRKKTVRYKGNNK